MASSLLMVDKSPSVDDLHSLLSKVTLSALFSWPSCVVEATLGMPKSYESKTWGLKNNQQVSYNEYGIANTWTWCTAVPTWGFLPLIMIVAPWRGLAAAVCYKSISF